MDILDNELVQRYWGHKNCDRAAHNPDLCRAYMAWRVLRAMQEPIRNGERYLFGDGSSWQEKIRIDENEDFSYHPMMLRLPDKFQPAKKACEPQDHVCEKCGLVLQPAPWTHQGSPCNHVAM